jgi:hypothetical protein
MQLVQPTAKPNVPTAQGLNLQPMTPGGGMGGQNGPIHETSLIHLSVRM